MNRSVVSPKNAQTRSRSVKRSVQNRYFVREQRRHVFQHVHLAYAREIAHLEMFRRQSVFLVPVAEIGEQSPQLVGFVETVDGRSQRSAHFRRVRHELGVGRELVDRQILKTSEQRLVLGIFFEQPVFIRRRVIISLLSLAF